MLCLASAASLTFAARTPSTVRMSAVGGFTDTISREERFLFDLNGFLIVRNVFTPEEVAAANAAVDSNMESMRARDATALRNAKSGTPFSATGPRKDMGGMLWWPKEQSEVFRSVLTHPKLVPYYVALLGEGYRMDHQPLLIAQDADSEGFSLHGGPISGDDGVPSGRFNPELQYRCVNGEMWNSLLAVSVQLCDHNEGEGGFVVVRGSHKLNLPVPSDFANGVGGDAFKDHYYQPATKAGDVVFFSEATVHGAMPWRAAHERRIALYRFAPANMGYGRGYLDVPESSLAGLTELQRAVVAPPYAVRLERPLVTPENAASERESAAAAADAATADGETKKGPLKRQRSEAKKEHDRKTIGTGYF